MNWLPKCSTIEIERCYFDGIINECTTGTPKYYWTGKKYYDWLWFEFSRNFKHGRDFKVEYNSIVLTKNPDKDVDIHVSFDC